MAALDDSFVSMRTITTKLDISRHTVYRWYKKGLIRRYLAEDGKTRIVRYSLEDIMKLLKPSDEKLPFPEYKYDA